MNAFQSILSAQIAAEEAAHKDWDKGYITLEEWRAKLDEIQLYYAEALHKENERLSSQPIYTPLKEVYMVEEVDVDNIDF